jgi:hypothetical protein
MALCRHWFSFSRIHCGQFFLAFNVVDQLFQKIRVVIKDLEQHAREILMILQNIHQNPAQTEGINVSIIIFY